MHTLYFDTILVVYVVTFLSIVIVVYFYFYKFGEKYVDYSRIVWRTHNSRMLQISRDLNRIENPTHLYAVMLISNYIFD